MTARDPIDALAEVLRIDLQGGVRRPLWREMDEDQREIWRIRARFVGDGLNRRGFALVPSPAASGGTKA